MKFPGGVQLRRRTACNQNKTHERALVHRHVDRAMRGLIKMETDIAHSRRSRPPKGSELLVHCTLPGAQALTCGRIAVHLSI